MQATRPSGRETPDRIEQHRVVRRFLELRLPDFPGAATLALGPQHFAQVRGDLGIRAFGNGAPEKLFGLVEVPKAKMRPPHAVENEGVRRRERVRLFDELQAFGRALGAVDQRVAQRV